MMQKQGLLISACSEHGQALILIVFGIIGLIGITALAVDGGRAFVDRRQAQNAADSAALAGGLARINGTNWVQAARNAAAANGYDNRGSSQVAVIACDSAKADCGVYTGNMEYIKVAITSTIQTSFAKVIGQNEITNRVETIVHTKPPEYKEILDGNAIVSLAPTSDCNHFKSFWIHGEATLDIWDAGIYINSNNRTCALLEQGSGSIKLEGLIDGEKPGEITVVGGASIQKPKLISPYPPQTDAIPISYPPPFYMPRVGCPNDAKISVDGESMSAGSWGDDFPPPGVHSLGAGAYCLGGDFILNSGDQLEGGNVVFRVDDGEVRWSGSAEIKLSGRKAGPLDGLLLYLPIDNHSRVVLNGNRKSAIKGTILAPSATIHLNGMESNAGFNSQIIGYRIEVNGTDKIVIKYIDDQNYNALTWPEVQLSK
jgi:Flp pilus assembly protein TadG